MVNILNSAAMESSSEQGQNTMKQDGCVEQFRSLGLVEKTELRSLELVEKVDS